MIRSEIVEFLKKAIYSEQSRTAGDGSAVDVSVPEVETLGHYSTNVAMRLAKMQGKKPMELAEEIATKLRAIAPTGFFEKIEAAAPGFINFWLSKETIKRGFQTLSTDGSFGTSESVGGRTVMVEFTDPNPFKLFHIGHLMSNTIGESFARLYEAAGAKVVRANYQGDVGLHVAKAVWGMRQLKEKLNVQDVFHRTAVLGEAYALGAAEYEKNQQAKQEIEEINKKIYADPNANDPDIDNYKRGREWSLAYFETIYERLGTKFDKLFFESEVGQEGLAIVLSRPDVFKKSDGAVIFPGEEYGLHTRVFINSQGLPTYEAKELGLNKKKFEKYPLDLSIIVTGNEIVDYFRVLLKAMELVLPDVAAKTRHAPHGMLRLPSGKMSSRTGDVITAESLLDDVKAKIAEHESEKSDLDPGEREIVTEIIAVGAIKYSILKQAPGQDIVFDFEKSLSIHGDSGPYLQYAYARFRSILRKAGVDVSFAAHSQPLLDSEIELGLMRKLFEFPDIVASAGKRLAPNLLATYLHQLATTANQFYESTPILKDEDEYRRNARLTLVAAVARTLKSGLNLLGIQAPEKI